jgi:hypothetical protein
VECEKENIIATAKNEIEAIERTIKERELLLMR